MVEQTIPTHRDIASWFGGFCARRHPLGFVFFRTINDAGIELRLNIWNFHSHRSTQCDFGIHDHSYAFSSVVLFGEMRNTWYLRSQCGENYHHYTVRYRKSHSVLTANGNVSRLLPAREKVLRIHDRYRLKAGEIHSTQPLSKRVVTFMCIGGPVKRPAVTYSRVKKHRLTFDRLELSGMESAHILQHVLAEM
jgi:hypothetical protein